MSSPFIAEIRIFAGNFPIRNWAFCNGQLISIAQNTALFSLLGTTFGGNGQTTFALPDLRGRTPVSPGQGPGLANYLLGEAAGAPTVALLGNQVPAHTHTPACFSTAPNPAPLLSPAGNVWAIAGARRTTTNLYATTSTPVAMNAQAVNPNNPGGAQPHNNLQPFLALNFIIALQGIFPSRN